MALRFSRGEKGATSLLFVSAVLGASVFVGSQMMRYVPLLAKQRAKQQSAIDHQIALTSAINYTKYAIKNHWCMTDAWLQDGSCSTFQTIYTHNRSFDRLILNQQSARAIQEEKLLNPMPSPLALQSISTELNWKAITENHPLYTALIPIQSSVKGVKIDVKRVTDVNLPTTGQEVIVQIRVEEFGASLTEENHAMTELFALYPQELGSYALIAQGNLILNGDAPSNYGGSDLGHLSFTQPVIRSNWKGKGLTFNSPVFTNGNIILPNSDTPGQEPRYTPVAFNDLVVLGKGTVFKDGKPFTPLAEAGLESLLNTYNPSFGGLRGGVRMQSTMDRGLAYLFQTQTLDQAAIEAATSNMKACITRNEILGDPFATAESRFVLKGPGPALDSDGTSVASYTLGLSKGNEFREATELSSKVETQTSTESATSPLIGTASVSNPSQKAVMKVAVKIGNHATVVASLGRSSTLEIPFQKLLTASDYSSLQKKYDELLSALQTKQNELNNKSGAFTTAETALQSAQNVQNQRSADLIAKQAQLTALTPPVSVDPQLAKEISTLEAEIKALETTLQGLKASEAQAQYDSAKKAYDAAQSTLATSSEKTKLDLAQATLDTARANLAAANKKVARYVELLGKKEIDRKNENTENEFLSLKSQYFETLSRSASTPGSVKYFQPQQTKAQTDLTSAQAAYDAKKASLALEAKLATMNAAQVTLSQAQALQTSTQNTLVQKQQALSEKIKQLPQPAVLSDEAKNLQSTIDTLAKQIAQQNPVPGAQSTINAASTEKTAAQTAYDAAKSAFDIVAANKTLIDTSMKPKLTLEVQPVNPGATQLQVTLKVSQAKSLFYPPSIQFWACDFGTHPGTCLDERQAQEENYKEQTGKTKSNPGPNYRLFPDFGSLAAVDSKKSSVVYSVAPVTLPDWSKPVTFSQDLKGPSFADASYKLNGENRGAKFPALPNEAEINPSQNLAGTTNCDQPKLGGDATIPAAFGATNGYDYADTSKISWGFAPLSAGVNTLVFDASTSSEEQPKPAEDNDFRVTSIAPICQIESTAMLVTGFYTCQELKILKRSKPLRIIGSFIVGKLSIDPSAFEQGISWSSIYEANAIYSLRAAKILNTRAGRSCDSPTTPFWNPKPPLSVFSDIYRCTPLSLRYLADPFTWSEVTPLCGLQQKTDSTGKKTWASATTCNLRNYPTRMTDVTYSRVYR
ncbi:MAG: hypothetical protein RJB38_2461 [Pseudomonadota bacterium]